jgi:type IVB pilus formation R64 PilN family outer membrane protein
MSKQVALNVKAYSVQLTNNDQYGIDWDLAFTRLNEYGLALANTSGVLGEGTSATVRVLSSTTGIGRYFGGTNAVLSALSTQGKVSEQISTTLVTLNNQPVPLQVGRQQAYVSGISVSQTANVGSTTQVTASQVTSGLDMSFVPHVQDDGRILLQYSMTMSDLQEMSNISYGGNTIQLPAVSLRSFMQRVSVRSGETLIMSGFEQRSLSANQKGVGSASNAALGGSQVGKDGRTLLVIVVQPTTV